MFTSVCNASTARSRPNFQQPNSSNHKHEFVAVIEFVKYIKCDVSVNVNSIRTNSVKAHVFVSEEDASLTSQAAGC